MADAWRKKKYYDKRVLLDTLSILDSDFPDVLVCLTGAQANMLRNMTQYLHRRSTYSENLTKTHYDAPSNEDWETILAIVANLEDKLMGCDLDLIVDAINANTQAITDMSVCVCALSSNAAGLVPTAVTNGGAEYAPNLALETAIQGTIVPVTDSDKCQLAYTWVGVNFEWLTETVLPLANGSGDAAAAAIAATTLFAVVTAGLGLSVAIVTALFLALVRYLFDYSTSNLINWMVGNGQELTCLLYTGLVEGGYEAAAWYTTPYIDESGLPLGDRMMLKLILTSSWAGQLIQYGITEGNIDPADYVAYSCAGCEEPAEYAWSGICAANEITHDICRDSYVALDVGRTLLTASPFTETGNFDCEILISNRMRQGYGGVFKVDLMRYPEMTVVRTAYFTTDTVDWETDEVGWLSVQADEYVIRIVPESGDKVCGVQWIKCNTT